MKNIIVDANMSRYELLFGEYKNHHGAEMCFVTWLKNSRSGPNFSWYKGEDIYASYALQKTDFNCRDLTGILSAIKLIYDGTVGDLMDFDNEYMNIKVVR